MSEETQHIGSDRLVTAADDREQADKARADWMRHIRESSLPKVEMLLAEPSLDHADLFVIGCAIALAMEAVCARHGSGNARMMLGMADASPQVVYDFLLRFYDAVRAERLMPKLVEALQ